jgi:hypothetical protein
MRRGGVRVAGLIVALVVTVSGCASSGAGGQHASAATPIPTTTTTTTAAATTTTTAQPLVPWTGPVEHLFFHTLVIRPELAFTGDQLAQGFRNYFVTVGEFRSILTQLDANGWTMVDIHRAAAGTIEVPAGRKPFVLSEDDVNYYDYSRPRGQAWRLVLDPTGAVKVEVRDDRGDRVTDDDLVPIVDEFVAAHPEFSADGAKGVLAVTGYEGILGERVNDPSAPDWAASVTRATAVANRLKATGWTFASHSYGHIDFSKDSVAVLTRDSDRWQAEALPIIGPTDVFIYPFGAEPANLSSPVVSMLRDHGFTILCDIDITPRLTHANGVTLMARRHIDGLAMEQQATRLAPFFDAAATEDKPARNARR